MHDFLINTFYILVNVGLLRMIIVSFDIDNISNERRYEFQENFREGQLEALNKKNKQLDRENTDLERKIKQLEKEFKYGK